VTVTDGTVVSIDLTVTVIFSCVATVPAGRALLARLSAASKLVPLTYSPA
jgi:hypothetical protein